MFVDIEHLQRRGADERFSAAEDARRLRSANCLAAAEHDQVGPGGGNGDQVLARGQFGRSVDQHGQVMGVRTFDHIVQRRARAGGHYIKHARGARPEGGFVLPGFDAAHAGAGGAS